MKPSSGKAKGRRLQNEVRETLLDRLRLAADDVKCAVMGERGRDIHCSPRAQIAWPYSTECKNTERLNIWDAIKQAVANAGNLTPLVVFRRNRSDTWAVVPFAHLVELNRELEHLRSAVLNLEEDLALERDRSNGFEQELEDCEAANV